MRWSPRQQKPERPGEALVREAAQFLEGQYLELAFVDGRDVPAWAWLSVLAHGDHASLELTEHWVRGHAGVRPDLDAWGRVIQHIAGEVLDTAAIAGCSLSELQRKLLVPLELAVITTPVGPATLYRLVSAMLADVKSRIGTERT